MPKLDYPGLPAAWTGQHVRRVAFDRSVAVVGDIHGRADLLAMLLQHLGPEVPVIVVGDLCDRGPDTRGVLELLVARRAIGVLGNHDLWLASWASGAGFDTLALAIGGAATLASYGVAPERADAVPAAHREWLLSLDVVLDLHLPGASYWITHAGIPSDLDLAGLTAAEVVPLLARTRAADLQWRANDPETMLPLDRPVVMGHRPMKRPLDTGDCIAIDTGAGSAGGRLTAVILPERKFVTVGP